MTFDKLYYLPFILIFLVFYIFFYRRNSSNFYKWVEDHWFYKKKLNISFSNQLYIIGIVLLAISLLDLKGIPEKITAKIPEQRTLIMLDTSSSMLAEDVRPNRFEKAIFLTRHFVKKALGHQVSVLVFSDTTKRLVPFTTDIELLDSRIEGLRSLNVNRGGTNLTQALSEAMQYLRNDKGEYSGNILVITDAEETEGGFSANVPSSVSVAAIGIGTAKGGNIPIRDKYGVFRGNKKFNGNEIVSRLDEVFLRKLGENIDNYNYWIATSYSLPTEQILNFFGQAHGKKFSEGEVTVQQVYLEWLLVPSLLLLAFSYVLRFGKSFALPIALFMSLNAFSEENERKPTPFDNKISFYKELLKNGEIEEDEKLKLAEYLMKAGDIKESSKVYAESLRGKKRVSAISQINYATSLIAEKRFDEALDLYSVVDSQLSSIKDADVSELRNIVKKNTLFALNQKKKQDKKKKEDKDKESKDKKDDKKQDQKKKDNKDDKKQDKKKKDDKKDNKDNKDKDKDGKDKEKKKGDKEKKEKEKKSEEPLKNKPDKPLKRVSKNKLPTLLKQLVNDDRKLQEKLIDASTQKRKQAGPKKDW